MILNMEYVRLGSSGVKVSRICLGCMSFGSGFDWMIPEEPSFGVIRKALDLGITFFDTADAYSHGASEQILGRALRELGVQRDDVVIATKVYQRYRGAHARVFYLYSGPRSTNDAFEISRIERAPHPTIANRNSVFRISSTRSAPAWPNAASPQA